VVILLMIIMSTLFAGWLLTRHFVPDYKERMSSKWNSFWGINQTQGNTTINLNQNITQNTIVEAKKVTPLQVMGWVIIVLIVCATLIFIAMMMKTKSIAFVNTRDKCLEFAMERINQPQSGYELEDGTGTLLSEQPYYDGGNKLFPRIAFFFSTKRIPQKNFRLKALPHHFIIMIDVDRRDMTNNTQGPMEMNIDQWREYRYRTRLGLTGERHSPIKEPFVSLPGMQQHTDAEKFKKLEEAFKEGVAG